MKVVTSKKARQIVLLIFMLVVLTIIVFSFVVNLVDIKYVATELNINKYEIQNKLLIDAMDNIGVCNPEDAVNVWSNGVKKRNAAIQYSVMTNELKKIYKAQLEKSFPSWVTGTSSPWVDSFIITEYIKKSDNTYTFHIKFTTMTSTGPAGDYNAILTIAEENSFWCISNIYMDKELYPYTGYKF